MPDFTYEEINAEVKRLGFTYPKNEDFTESEISEAILGLPDYHLTTEVATLKSKKVTGDTLAAFAKLASTLGASITTAYEGLSVVRDTSSAERRESALNALRAAVAEEHRRAARVSLGNML